MASTAIQQPSGHSTSFEPLTTQAPVQANAEYKPKDVQTILNYHKPSEDGSPPPPTYVGRPETYERPVNATNATIHDVRGNVKSYNLDNNGFQFINHTSAEKDFTDEEKIKSAYYAEVEQLLKDSLGATRVFIFDHTIRRAPQPSADGAPAMLRAPVMRVHVDQSYTASRSRVPFHLPEEADRLLGVRHQIVNVWRPIKQVFKDPLTVADAHSVPDSDLVPIGLIYPNRKGETLAVHANPAHRWHYLAEQRPDEPLLIKCYDSKLDGRARRVPHTAFSDPAHVDNYARESIEVRTLVFYEDQSAE